MFTIVFVLLAYLIGSVSFAVLVSKGFGLPDPHTYGSKNPGATNVLRTGKKLPAILTLLGDGAKGWLAVFLADYFLPGVTVNEWALAAVALAVFLGHLFPIFHRFAGGKGVATALGILLALHAWLGLCVLFIWLAMAVIVRISSLSALVAAFSAPLLANYFFGFTPLFWVVVVISALLVWRHKSNIQKLLRGGEGKIGA